jgi:hypothetical protein
MDPIICAKCGKPLELMSRSSFADPALDSWIGNFCPQCKNAYCFDCQKTLPSTIICPKCGGVTLPAARSLLREFGVMAN